MSDNAFYTQLNTGILVFGLISGILFVFSEILGYINRYSSRCKSIAEFILKFFNIIREPTLDERLAYLSEERQRVTTNMTASSTTDMVNV